MEGWFVFFFGDAEAVLGPALNKKNKKKEHKWWPCVQPDPQNKYANDLFTKLSGDVQHGWWLVSFSPDAPGVPSTKWEQLKLVDRPETVVDDIIAALPPQSGGAEASGGSSQVPSSPVHWNGVPTHGTGVAVQQGHDLQPLALPQDLGGLQLPSLETMDGMAGWAAPGGVGGVDMQMLGVGGMFSMNTHGAAALGGFDGRFDLPPMETQDPCAAGTADDSRLPSLDSNDTSAQLPSMDDW